MQTILVTGGTGYIGSHTIVELLTDGRFEVISVDNYANSTPEVLNRIEIVVGKRPTHYAIDICDKAALQAVFQAHKIAGVIHFAAHKSVGLSVEMPVMFYQNNITGMLNVLECCQKFGVKAFLFSSSCSVYGNPQALPVTEETPLQPAESPYAFSKVVGERMLSDATKAGILKGLSLRYFNPVGAHISGKLGEVYVSMAPNFVPVIIEAAAGVRKELRVFGTDWNTRDGSCVRDYIHVTDIATGHLQAIDYLLNNPVAPAYDIFNLGSGQGTTVLEAIAAFERVTGIKLPVVLAARRSGDVEAVYSDCIKARTQLGWIPRFGLDEMMASAWQWQQNLSSL